MFLAIVVPSILMPAILNLLDEKNRVPTGSGLWACTREKRGTEIKGGLTAQVPPLLIDPILPEEKHRVANLVQR